MVLGAKKLEKAETFIKINGFESHPRAPRVQRAKKKKKRKQKDFKGAAVFAAIYQTFVSLRALKNTKTF